MKGIKKTNDFVLGILMILLSAGLFFGKVTSNVPEVSQGGPIASPDVWHKMIAAQLFIVSLILVISSLDFGRDKGEKEPFQFHMGSTAILTVIALVVYAALLPVAGFAAVTFVITAFLVAIYTLSEEKLSLKEVTKSDVVRIGRKSIITGIIMLAILWAVFGILLEIPLP